MYKKVYLCDMRYISSLNELEVSTLKDLSKYHPNHVVRRRGHALLLSNKKYSVSQLCDIFEVDYRTIIDWINRWERHGLGGLHDQSGRGRKPLLNDCEKKSGRRGEISSSKYSGKPDQTSLRDR